MELKVLIDRQTVQHRVAALARQIAGDYPGTPPLLVGVLNGAVQFLVDLLGCMPEELLAEVEYDFVAVSSYEGRRSRGTVALAKDLAVEVGGRDVLVVEGIVDTGLTLQWVLADLAARSPRSVRVCALLDKPSRRRHAVPLDYVGFCIPDVFVVGCGLDQAQRFRGLRYIGVPE